jgi:hypothetical protein
MYKILREATHTKLEEAMNNIAETHKPVGTIVIDTTTCYVILMEEK